MPELWQMDDLFTMLKELTELPGASGAEKPVRDYIAKALAGHVDSLEVDNLGNLIAFKKGSGKSRRKVALFAHMDEVGLTVTGADEEGYLKIDSLGGVDPHVLLAKRVKVGDDITGIIGYKPIHLQEPKEREKRVKLSELRVDIGAKDKDEALSKAPLGTPIHFDSETHFLGTSADFPEDGRLPASGRLIGKAFDDRIGCLAMIAVLKGLELPYDLHAVFTILEEEGLRGAKPAAWEVEPDIAVILESTVADDLPREEDLSPSTRLGAGPAITIMDRRTITDPKLAAYFVGVAEAEGIPIQVKQPGVGGTDARVVQVSRRGARVGILAVPSRYIHSPSSVIELSDFVNMLKLLEKALPDMLNALE